jgi:hypothetical protein
VPFPSPPAGALIAGGKVSLAGVGVTAASITSSSASSSSSCSSGGTTFGPVPMDRLASQWRVCFPRRWSYATWDFPG